MTTLVQNMHLDPVDIWFVFVFGVNPFGASFRSLVVAGFGSLKRTQETIMPTITDGTLEVHAIVQIMIPVIY